MVNCWAALPAVLPMARRTDIAYYITILTDVSYFRSVGHRHRSLWSRRVLRVAILWIVIVNRCRRRDVTWLGRGRAYNTFNKMCKKNVRSNKILVILLLFFHVLSFRYFVFVLLLSIRTAECRPYTLDAASSYLLLSVDGWYQLSVYRVLSVRAPALADWSTSAAVAGDCIRNVFVTTMFYEFRLRSVAIRWPRQIPQVDELREVTTHYLFVFVICCCHYLCRSSDEGIGVWRFMMSFVHS